MTTPKPDKTQVLIAELRRCQALNDDGLAAGHSPKLFQDTANALARDHAIVERVTKLCEEGELNGHHVYTSELIKALIPPAEQPPRSETRFCGVKMDIGGVEVACTGELPCETHSRETPAVAKCEHSWPLGQDVHGFLPCSKCGLNYPEWKAAAQPKPSPDNVAQAKASFGAVLAKKHFSDCDIDLLWEAITKARS